MSLIKCTELKMGYNNQTVLENLSFEIKEGDYLCIVGENGSGKTTLMKGLLGLNSVSGGKIEYSDGLKQRYIGYLPQQKNIKTDFPGSVYEVVLSGTLNRSPRLFYSKEQKQIARESMEKVGVYSIRKRSFQELSGGQQQRVLLARALSATTKLLILDEPTTGLDPLATQDLYDIINKLNSSGITIVMVSHDINSAVKNGRNILHLTDNSYFYGTTHQYMHSDIGTKFLIKDCPCDECKHSHGGALC